MLNEAGARSIAPQKLPANRAEQCSALRRVASLQRSQNMISPRIFPLDIHIKPMYRVPMIRKELVAASAEPMILVLLARGESYGYAIIQEVKVRSGGKLQWTDGMLYPVLHRMEHRGLIKSRWGESETGRKREILLAQERRQDGHGQTPRAMVAGPFHFGRFEKGAICLISIKPSRVGASKCSPPESKHPCRWRNWKFICAKKLSGR